ncbi:MAG: dockerin type I repeat-containing protein, partial [Planctomycetota bacterium]
MSRPTTPIHLWPSRLRWSGSALVLLFTVTATSIGFAQTTFPAGPTPVPVDFNEPFIRGDANADGSVNIADCIRILDFLFPPTSPTPGVPAPIPCRDAADFNDDEGVDIADAVYGLSHLFSGGPDPSAPFDAC